jgi:hypothetical protein
LLLNSGIAPGTFNLDPNGKAQLRCGDFVEALTKYCPKQLPTLGGWGDDVLDLAKNVRSTLPSNRAFWEGTSSEPWVRERTDSFVPPAILEECVEASKQHRLVVLVGGAGTGKSSIAAALANPRATSGVVPEAFTHAAAFIEGLNFSAAFAELLSDQLAQSEAAFRERRDLLRAKLSTNELAAAPLEAHVLDPLREIRKIVKAPVRIVIDALDRANHILFKTILDLLHAISTDKNLTHVRVVLTTQPLEGLPQGAKTLKVPIPNDRTLREYMSQQGVPERLHKTILRRARGSWLYVRLLANQVREDPEIRASDLPGSRGQLYARYLDLAGGQDPYRRKHLLRPVLSALSVAGTGPVLPICLLFEAAARLGCKERETAIRDLFSDLRGLLERDQVGTARERVGFFHKTVAEDLRSNALNVLHDESVAHEAMLDAIEQRAPLETLKSCTPLERHELQNRDDCYRYAFEFEMEHLAAAGRWDSLIDSLRFRDSATPAINLKRWSLANGFVADALPEHDERRLTVRLYQADWLRRSSDFREALIRTRQLIRDCRRHLTRKHTLTLAALHLRSECVGERSFSPEDIHRALQLARAVLSRQLDVLGPHHEQVLTTKNDIAVWLGETDRFAEALDHFRALLIEQTKILGPDHTDTLITRYHIAYYTGKNCEPAKAKQLMEALLNDQIRVHGERHPETLDTRYQVAYWNSDLEESLTELNSVLLDRTDVLGPYHADTVGTRREISTRTWLAKDESAGLAMFRSLLEDLDRDLGRDHALTRKMHARCEKLIKALRAGKKALGIDISPPNSLSR